MFKKFTVKGILIGINLTIEFNLSSENECHVNKQYKCIKYDDVIKAYNDICEAANDMREKFTQIAIKMQGNCYQRSITNEMFDSIGEFEEYLKSITFDFHNTDKDTLSFHVDMQLGKGTYATVYSSMWGEDKIALKAIKYNNNTVNPTIADCEREKEILEILTYSNAPYTMKYFGYAIDEKATTYYLATEYMAGGTLKDLISEASNEPSIFMWQSRYRMIKELATGLDYMHQHGILHRDLKSSNVLLDENYCVKIGDFGSAKKIDKSVERVGTISWVAPEVYRKKCPSTAKADIFSLSIIMWEIAHLKLPYENLENFAAIENHVMVHDKREEISSECPSRLANLIERSWQINPGNRPTLREIIDEIPNKSISRRASF